MRGLLSAAAFVSQLLPGSSLKIHHESSHNYFMTVSADRYSRQTPEEPALLFSSFGLLCGGFNHKSCLLSFKNNRIESLSVSTLGSNNSFRVASLCCCVKRFSAFKGHKMRKVHWYSLYLPPSLSLSLSFLSHCVLRPSELFPTSSDGRRPKKTNHGKAFQQLITTGWGLWKAALFVSGPVSIKGLIQEHLKPRAVRRTALKVGLKDALVAVCCFSIKWWNNIWRSRINMMRGNGAEARGRPVKGLLFAVLTLERWVSRPLGRVFTLTLHLPPSLAISTTIHTRIHASAHKTIQLNRKWHHQQTAMANRLWLLWLNLACESSKTGLWAALYVIETRLMTQTKSRKKLNIIKSR